MGMESLLNSLLVSDTSSLGVLDIFLTLFIPYFLTLFIGMYYRYSVKGTNYSVAFIHSLLLFSSLTSIITLLIGSNIARAFGLVAALSIIRFRTALKSSLDSVYMFWALAIGMACGTGYYLAAIMIVAFGIFFQFVTQYFRFGEVKKISYVMKVNIDNKKLTTASDQLEQQLASHVRHFEKINVLYDSNASEQVHVYTVEGKLGDPLEMMRSNLGEIDGIGNIHLLNTEATLFN